MCGHKAQVTDASFSTWGWMGVSRGYQHCVLLSHL